MGKLFKSNVELEGYIRQQLESVLDEVYEECLDTLLDIIQEDVYTNAHSNSKKDFYKSERTRDLLKRSNWEIKKYKYGNKINRKLSFKDGVLTLPSSSRRGDPNSFTHGNIYGDTLSKNVFLGILNNDYKQGEAFNFPTVERDPFWDDFIEFCDKNLQSVFESKCRAHGIPISNIAISK